MMPFFILFFGVIFFAWAVCGTVWLYEVKTAPLIDEVPVSPDFEANLAAKWRD